MDFYTSVYLRGNDILLIGYENGRRRQVKMPCRPYLFMGTRNEGEYRTIDNRNVDKIEFDSPREARAFTKQYEHVDGVDLYGLTNYVYPFIYDEFKGDIQYDPSLISTVFIDIEVQSDEGFPRVDAAAYPITAICMSKDKHKYVLGCNDFDNEDPDNVTYFQCRDEVHLLKTFITIWRRLNPDVVTGWNVEFFDIPYLVNRIERVMSIADARQLSPWGYLNQTTVQIMGNDNTVYYPIGLTVLDYLQLYRKFAFSQQESYKLDHIAHVELGEKKIDYSEYGDLFSLYRENYQKFIEYNIKDVELVERLDDKLKLLELVYAFAYDSKVLYQDTFTTVRLWDVIIHNYLMERNCVVPFYKPDQTDRSIMGGFVKEPHVGMHDWVVSFDLNSLYPHLIMQYNISPDTFMGKIPSAYTVDDVIDGKVNEIREQMVEQNFSITANFCRYTKNGRGFLPTLMERMYDDRSVFKKKMLQSQQLAVDEPNNPQHSIDASRYENLQMSKKIALNSAYGALANKYYRWFENDVAESITSSGQLSIRWMHNKLNDYMNDLLNTGEKDYIIAVDTDSLYIDFGGFVEKFCKDMSTDKIVKYLDQVCTQRLEKYIDKCYAELADYMNAYDQKMVMKRECIADKAVWTGKKRYILNVHNNEGVQYTEPKLKMQGIEAIRTSTPQVCRTAIKGALNTIMNQDNAALIKYIADFRKEFEQLPFIDIAFPRGVNDMEKWADASTIFKKSTPIHVKGSLQYNHAIRTRNLTNKYPLINQGEKIKFAYCVEPNPLQVTVISCPDTLPPELGMDKYIDKEKQFEKTFLDPIKTIAKAINWDVEHKQTLESFFS